MPFPARLFSPLKLHRATTPVVICPQRITGSANGFMRAAGKIAVLVQVYISCRTQSEEAARIRRALVLLVVVSCVSMSACARNFGQGM